ncbi:mitogen-activated protein kinase kinase kinase [Entomophthora muscae]|uniref:Mitogen-activated protein kinase kinase kinase n=1 Tax=Entomophthora muscae TaxID=34485 RepID=A0ACC2T6E0_9FUNG|nr:mitogen-activated protein kinase kinase kinase [Entomophthora muscae]
MEEKFSDPLDVEAPIDIDIKLEEEFADPLSPAPPFIPDDPFIEETFSDPLAVEAPFITDDFFVEESFSDPLGVLAPEIIPEFDFDISFSDPLDTEPPPVVSPTHKDAFIEFQDQILPLQSNPNSSSWDRRNTVYCNSVASISAPSLSDWGENTFKSRLAHDYDGETSPLEASEQYGTSFDYDYVTNKENVLPVQALQPIIKPRKESMINLEKPWKGGFAPRSPTHRDAILSSQRRSSLFYDSDPSKLLDFHSKKMEILHTFPRETQKVDLPVARRVTSKLRPTGNESSFFGNLLPDFFKPFSKHNRKLSFPDDIKSDKNKVIQVSLEDSVPYSVNIGGCTSAEEISKTIFSTLLLDNESHRYHIEEILADGTTRLVSSRQLLVLCSKTDSRGLVRFMLRKLRKAKEPPRPSIPNSPSEVSAPPVPKVSEEVTLPSWAQMWGERPSTEIISSNLEEFFPGYDVDSPILDQSPETPFETLGRKKSIRMVVEENQHRLSSCLSRRSTKLWGSRITQLKDESVSESLNQENPDIPEELRNLQAATQIKWIKGKGIGKGSFGRVFHALNAATGEMLAVKEIDLPSPKKPGSNPGPNIGRKRGDMIKELYREIELLKDLDHDNIVQYLGFEASSGCINIFLEYVSGGSIASVLLRTGPFDELYAASLIRQTVKGLAYLHSCNILHRDIKAANVLINHEGVCKISDFGISKRNDYARAYRYNSRMSFKGSVFWMAPEVVIDHGYSAKVDIWSLGCLLIEMLTGTRPWKELNELAAVYRLGKSTSESAPPIPSGISPEAESFLGQCFIIEPESRPTAEQILEHEYFRNSSRRSSKLKSSIITVEQEIKPTAHTILPDPLQPNPIPTDEDALEQDESV